MTAAEFGARLSDEIQAVAGPLQIHRHATRHVGDNPDRGDQQRAGDGLPPAILYRVFVVQAVFAGNETARHRPRAAS